MAPLVSVVTATLNAATSVLRTARSLDGQQDGDLEWLVIDGGSHDGTAALVEEHSRALAYVTSERDGGIYDAWNKALAIAKGEWIAFLGAGDTYEPDAVARYRAAAARGGAGGRGRLQYISSRVALLAGERRVRTIGKAWRWEALRSWMCVAHVGSFHHRSLFEDGCRFDTTYRICGDYEFLLRCGPGLVAAFVPAVTAAMQTGGASDSLARAMHEAERAKVSTGARGPALARVQRVLALGRASLRKALWY